jgi:hypothetical protein
MTERREIKQRSRKVWDAAKAAYLAGEPAASVARRFDVGYGNLRYRAHAEGWTRKAHAAAEAGRDAGEERLAAGEGPGPAVARPAGELRTPIDALTPRQQMVRGLKTAARRLAEGRPAEAEALIRAVRALSDLTRAPPPALDELEDDPVVAVEALARAVEYRAFEVAAALTATEPDPPRGSEAFYFHLRDRHGRRRDGGPNVDRAWAETHRPDLLSLWDAEGRVPAPAEPDDEEMQTIVAVLGAGIRLRRDGDLKTWVAEAIADAARDG